MSEPIKSSLHWTATPTARDRQWALEAHYICDAGLSEAIAEALAEFREECCAAERERVLDAVWNVASTTHSVDLHCALEELDAKLRGAP